MADSLLGWPTWIGVVVEDLEEARRFWRDVIGFAEITATDDYAELDLGMNRRLELLARSDAPQYDRPRFQVGFEVDDVRAAREELIGRGVEPVSEVEKGEDSAWCYFRDPQGNVFEITHRSER
jgi:catechol 2,3-dioxygenase-like lactoylglutathione lyase family enzyme